jgi:hypothetical protein
MRYLPEIDKVEAMLERVLEVTPRRDDDDATEHEEAF